MVAPTPVTHGDAAGHWLLNTPPTWHLPLSRAAPESPDANRSVMPRAPTCKINHFQCKIRHFQCKINHFQCKIRHFQCNSSDLLELGDDTAGVRRCNAGF